MNTTYRTFFRLTKQTGSVTYQTLDQKLEHGNLVYDSSLDPITDLNKYGQRAVGIDIILMECQMLQSYAEAIYGRGRYVVIETNQILEKDKVRELKTIKYFDEGSFTATKERIRQAARDRQLGKGAPRFTVYEILREKRAVLEGGGTESGVKFPFDYKRVVPQGIQTEIIYEKGRGVMPRPYIPKNPSSPLSSASKPKITSQPQSQLTLFSETVPPSRKVVPIRPEIDLAGEHDDEVPF